MEKTAEELAAEATAAEAEAAAAAAAADEEPEPEGAEQLGDAGADDVDQLGEAGKKALDAWKKRAKLAEAKLAKAGAGPSSQNRKEASTLSEFEKSLETKANARIVRSEIRAAAAGKLADPKDALIHLRDRLDQFEVDANGEVDSEEVADAITKLLEEKPYLAAATAKRFQGTGDGGAARKAGGVKQVTEAELKTMTPDQIVKAQNEGRLSDLLSAG